MVAAARRAGAQGRRQELTTPTLEEPRAHKSNVEALAYMRRKSPKRKAKAAEMVKGTS